MTSLAAICMSAVHIYYCGHYMRCRNKAMYISITTSGYKCIFSGINNIMVISLVLHEEQVQLLS